MMQGFKQESLHYDRRRNEYCIKMESVSHGEYPIYEGSKKHDYG